MASGTTGALTYAMSKNQNDEVTKTVALSEEATPSAIRTDSTVKPIDFKIEAPKEKRGSIQRRETDLPVEDAVSRAAQKIREIYGNVKILRAAEVDLENVGADEKGSVSYRAYCGVIVSEGNLWFDFTVNAITGEVMGITKGKYSDMKIGLGITYTPGEVENYKKTARKFVMQDLDRNRIQSTEMFVYCSAGQKAEFSWCEGVIRIECQTQDGALWQIDIIPGTDDVLGWYKKDGTGRNLEK